MPFIVPPPNRFCQRLTFIIFMFLQHFIVDVFIQKRGRRQGMDRRQKVRHRLAMDRNCYH